MEHDAFVYFTFKTIQTFFGYCGIIRRGHSLPIYPPVYNETVLRTLIFMTWVRANLV